LFDAAPDGALNVLAEQLAEAIAFAPLSNLDDLSRDVWRAWAAKLLDDDGAQHLAEVIHIRRTVAWTLDASQRATQPRTSSTSSWSYFPASPALRAAEPR
jgi:hypothetical protein